MEFFDRAGLLLLPNKIEVENTLCIFNFHYSILNLITWLETISNAIKMFENIKWKLPKFLRTIITGHQ